MVATVPAKRGRKPAATTTAQQGGQVQSLTRGLKLLEWIAESHGSVALTELAQQAGLPNSTTHRLLTTMQQLGFVRQVASWGTGRWARTRLSSAAASCRAATCWRLCTRFCAS